MYPHIPHILTERIGVAGALALRNIPYRRFPAPSWLGLAGLILVASTPNHVHRMYHDLEVACRPKGLRIIPKQLQLEGMFQRHLVCVGGHSLRSG